MLESTIIGSDVRNLIFIALLFISLTMLFLAVIAWKKRHTSGMAAVLLSVCFFGVSIYNFGYAFEIINNSLSGKMIWVRFQHLGIFAIIPCWLIFTLIITGREQLITPARIGALFIVPLIVLISSQTLGSLNWLHINPHLDTVGSIPSFDYERGIITYLFVAYICVCLVITTILFTLMLVRAAPGFRWQAWIYWLSALVPWFAGILYNLHLVPSNLDITPFSFSISRILLGLGFFQLHLLDIIPLARDVVFEGMFDGVLVLDVHDSVVDMNPSFVKMLPNTRKAYFGRPAAEVFVEYPDLLAQIQGQHAGTVDLNVSIGQSTLYYRSALSPLYKGQTDLVGKVVMIHDVTQSKKLMQNLEELAQHDGLTGVYNRQHFFKLANAELYRMKRYGGACSLIMFDLDHFKRINDTFGHAAGDHVLRMVIDTIQPLLRQSDIIGRFGGEEFLIMCPETDPEKCQVIIDRLRLAIERKIFLENEDIKAITASFGITGIKEPFYAPLDELVQYADRAMYEAKNRGGNTICIQLPLSRQSSPLTYEVE